jgi:uncharacterized damage-inducible protein DinB
MAAEAHPAGANIHYLQQGEKLVRNLTDEIFAECPRSPYRGGVGAQLRHCLDFYDCFLDGLDRGTIDYNARGRDTRLETDRDHALRKIRTICVALERLTPEQAGRSLDVRTEGATENSVECTRSSTARELQFLISHTIHHFALIAIMLELEGNQAARDQPDFGVAPSTLAHWKEKGSFVG